MGVRKPVIRLENVSKDYHTKVGTFSALKNINLTVEKGEIFGVIGKSGAGKSTLIRCINLLERPTSGKVEVAHENLTDLSQKDLRFARRKIGMIFQHFSLLNTRTVFENVAFPLQLTNTPPAQINDIVLPLLEYVHLLEKKDHYPSKLSGGQKQRVAIARALVNKPDILLCDEATSALDPQTTQTVLSLLQDANKRFGLTILLITHEMQVIKQICDRVALLEEGHIVEEANIINFFTHPQTQVAKKLVKSCLNQELPSVLQTKIIEAPLPHSHPLLRIFFYGDYASEPLVSYLVREFNLIVNILQANIEVIKQQLIGIMTLEIIDEDNKLHHAMAYLKDKGVQVEVIGYVRHDVE